MDIVNIFVLLLYSIPKRLTENMYLFYIMLQTLVDLRAIRILLFIIFQK